MGHKHHKNGMNNFQVSLIQLRFQTDKRNVIKYYYLKKLLNKFQKI